MKYQLINQPNEKYTVKEQILINRGIEEKELNHYINLTDNDINEPEMLGEDVLFNAATTVWDTLSDPTANICVVVDSDADGYTSAAILLNYLNDLLLDEVECRVHYFMHEGKQHGLSDAMDWIFDVNPRLVIVPDGGTNNVEELKKLGELGTSVIILDHHLVEENEFWEQNPKSCGNVKHYLINSQLPHYSNKELSGAGVVYQFCKYIDKIKDLDYANKYLDLVATGLVADMMDLRSVETRRLITKGLVPDNIVNPFVYSLWQKNKFKIGDIPTAWGFTFYVVPLINAITRSGTQDEKDTVFNSMLKYKAFKEVPSTKRGHKPGEKERIVDQAMRICTNVKNRQSKQELQGLELVEHLIEDKDMMQHKVLLFLLEPNQIPAPIRGLIANKIQAKYQRPCCMLTKTIDKESGRVSYQGSARGCDRVGVTDFKSICAGTSVCDYTVGRMVALRYLFL